MKKIKQLLEKPWFAYTFATCAAVLLYLLVSHIKIVLVGISWIWGLLKPIVGGAVLAYLLDPIVMFFENNINKAIKKDVISRSVAIVITWICFFAAVALLLVLVIPSVYASIKSIIGNFPAYQRTINEFVDWINKTYPQFDMTAIQKSLEGGLDFVINYIPKNAGAILNASIGIGTGAFNVVLAIILAIYFLSGKSGLLVAISRLRQSVFTDETNQKHSNFLRRCNEILITYIGFSLLDALIIGSLNAVAMTVAGMQYIPLVSVVVAITNLVPTFGPMVGGVIGAFVLAFANPVHALIFIVITIVLQIFDGYILKPKMFGKQLGVPPVGILITIILGGGMFGIMGIVLAIPFAAILTIIYNEAIIPAFIRAKESRHNNQP